MNNSHEIGRAWSRNKQGNVWFYEALIKFPLRQEPYTRHLGSVYRITDQRSANYNKWIVEIPFTDSPEPFLSRKPAMAYVVAITRLT